MSLEHWKQRPANGRELNEEIDANSVRLALAAETLLEYAPDKPTNFSDADIDLVEDPFIGRLIAFGQRLLHEEPTAAETLGREGLWIDATPLVDAEEQIEQPSLWEEAKSILVQVWPFSSRHNRYETPGYLIALGGTNNDPLVWDELHVWGMALVPSDKKGQQPECRAVGILPDGTTFGYPRGQRPQPSSLQTH